MNFKIQMKVKYLWFVGVIQAVVGFQTNSHQSYFDYLQKNSQGLRQRRENQVGNATGRVIVIDPRSLFSPETKPNQFQFEKDVKFNFTKIGGYNEIKRELHQLKELLQDNDLLKNYNVRVPKGLLLEGPPGNGKTLLAKCFAGECGFNFISVSGAEFNEKYVGVGASRVREIFNNAKKNQPCVIFIDELDAIGAKRSTNDEGASTERFQTLNQLLVLMDGFDADNMRNIFVIGATNRKDILDPALTRSGRFDKVVHVPNPDTSTRSEIIKIHRDRKPITLETSDISEITDGMSGADIETLLNEVSLLALRENKLVDSLRILEHVRDRILLGSISVPRVMTPELERRVAIHESGHLFMGFISETNTNPTKVTIEASNHNSLGYTYFGPSKADVYSTKYLKERIMILLAGRVAEMIFFGDEISTGAIDDIDRVLRVAKEMVLQHAMTERPRYSLLSESVKKVVDSQIQRLVEDCYQETFLILTRNKRMLEWFIERLLRKKTMNKSEIIESLRLGTMLFPSLDFGGNNMFSEL
jgi:cell division protease FtsH